MTSPKCHQHAQRSRRLNVDDEPEGIDRAQLARAGAGRRIELDKIKPEASGYPMGRFV